MAFMAFWANSKNILIILRYLYRTLKKYIFFGELEMLVRAREAKL